MKKLLKYIPSLLVGMFLLSASAVVVTQINESQVKNLVSDLAAKEPTITAGTSLQYYRGDKSMQTLNTAAVPESGNLYYSNARTINSTLTGYSAAAGAVSSSDNILQALQKLDGNIAANTTALATKAIIGDDNTVNAMQALGSAIKGYPLNLPILNTSSTITLGNGVLVMTAVVIPKATTITGAKFYIQTTGSYTASNYNGVALFTISGGTATLVASSTNDGNIWKGSFGINSKAFSSTYSAAAGVYYLGIVYSQSAQVTNPAIYSNSSSTGVSGYDFTNGNKIVGTVNSITALPSTQAMSGVTLTANIPYLTLY